MINRMHDSITSLIENHLAARTVLRPIHEHTILLRFLGMILRVLRLEVSVYNVDITNQFQTTFAQGGKGRVKSVRRGDCEY
jgi:hypothetical protein